MEKVRAARSSSLTASNASTRARSATRASSALARGDLAFHSSQTDGAKLSGVSVPAARPADAGCMITAPEPRCDSTSAIGPLAAVRGPDELGVVQCRRGGPQALGRRSQHTETGDHDCSSKLSLRSRVPGTWMSAARAAASARTHHARSSASRSSRGSSGAKRARSVGSGAWRTRDEDVGQHVHGVAQRRHLELDRHEAQLLDRPAPRPCSPSRRTPRACAATRRRWSRARSSRRRDSRGCTRR